MMSSYRLSGYVASNKPTDCYSTTGMCKPLIFEERGRERERGRREGGRERGRKEGRRGRGRGEGERRGIKEGGRERMELFVNYKNIAVICTLPHVHTHTHTHTHT